MKVAERNRRSQPSGSRRRKVSARKRTSSAAACSAKVARAPVETVPTRSSSAFDLLLREVARPDECRAEPLAPGSRLVGGRLRVGKRIGEGGMGAVYEVFDTAHRRTFALKTLLKPDATNIYRLKNEFRSLCSLEHPNLVGLRELFADEQRWFFTMELVRGLRFDLWVRPQGRLDAQRLHAALVQMLAAVEAIHGAGKLHRDLKPSNVLVTANGEVRVLDFGLVSDAQPGGIGQTLVDAGVSGTPAYLAPEQAAGAAATTAADYYAVGVMAFEALTGRLPFEGRLHEMLVDKQRRAAPAVREVCPDAPAELAALCDGLLAREPAQRSGARALRAQLCVPGPRVSAVGHARRPVNASSATQTQRGSSANAAFGALRDAYEQARVGRSVVMFVAGDEAVRSDLVNAFGAELSAQGDAALLSGACFARERVPFNGIDSLVDDLSRYLRKLPAVDAAGVMPRDVHALARVFPVLSRVEAVAQAPCKALADRKELRLRAYAALCELLGRVCDRRPLVLHIANAQWLDRDARALLGHVLAHPDPFATLLLLSYGRGAVGRPASLASLRTIVSNNPGWRSLDVRCAS